MLEMLSIVDLRFLLMVLLGSVAGLFVGAIPGLSHLIHGKARIALDMDNRAVDSADHTRLRHGPFLLLSGSDRSGTSLWLPPAWSGMNYQ